MLITWTARALFESGAADAPWNSEENLTVKNATDYFFGEYAGMKTLRADDQRPTRLVGANVGYSFLVHFFIFICVAKGMECFAFLLNDVFLLTWITDFFDVCMNNRPPNNWKDHVHYHGATCHLSIYFPNFGMYS